MSWKEERHLLKLWGAGEIFLGICVVCGQRFWAGCHSGIEKDMFVAGESDVQGSHGRVRRNERVSQDADYSFGCIEDSVFLEDL